MTKLIIEQLGYTWFINHPLTAILAIKCQNHLLLVYCSVTLSNTLQPVWDLAVQTLGLQPGSISRLFSRKSLSLEYSGCP